jgi:hypothetical protein
VVELDERAGRAVVAITLVEISDSAPRGQRITGTWHLVRGPSGWLLDQPALQLVNI